MIPDDQPVMSEHCIVHLDNLEEYMDHNGIMVIINVLFIFECLTPEVLMHPYAKAHCSYLAGSEP